MGALLPFDDFDDDFIEDVIASDFQPNLFSVDDNTIWQLVASYLAAGNPSMPEGRTLRGNSTCVTARVVFADCVSVRPHTYEKVVHCQRCNHPKECCFRGFLVQDTDNDIMNARIIKPTLPIDTRLYPHQTSSSVASNQSSVFLFPSPSLAPSIL